jgi:subtilisin
MPVKTVIRAPAGTEGRASARYTGRYLLSYAPQAGEAMSATLQQYGFPRATPLPPRAQRANALPHGQHYIIPTLGVAVVDPRSDQEDTLLRLAHTNSAILSLVPERVVHMIDTGATSNYVRGWRDAINALSDRMLDLPAPAEQPLNDVAEAMAATWGLVAARVPPTRYSGQGIKIAILDTGLDQSHPDFANRAVVTKNFVGDGTEFHDGVGHGTHCTGTAAGPLQPHTGPRYGIAYNAEIYAGRVLDDSGSGSDANVLQGIDWAISQGCAVASLSLGSAWQLGDPDFDGGYEQYAQTALQHGCLLVIAAGNEANQIGYIGALGVPGNSPSAVAVAAVDEKLKTAWFSDRVEPKAPGVKGPDIAAPGVGVYSAWLTSDGNYRKEDGTSMATPHVAGIAALLAESDSRLRGQALKDALLKTCKVLDGGKRRGEVGSGLVQAP